MTGTIEEFYNEACVILGEEELKYKEVPEVNGWYFWSPVRGGGALIINNKGERLFAASCVNFSRHLEEFKQGRRSV